MAASGLLNFLQTAVKPPSSPLPNVASVNPSTADAGNANASGLQFARMVKESSQARQDARDTLRDTADARVTTRASTTTATRPARRESVNTSSNDTLTDLDRKVTPKDAADLLNDLETAQTDYGNGAMDSGTQQQLKNQLNDIIATDQPKSLGEILAAVAMHDGRTIDAAQLATQAATVITDPQPTSVAALTHSAQRVLQLITKSFANHASEELPTQDDSTGQVAASAINPALLALQAAPFQAATPATVDGAQTAEASAVTVVTPLAQQTAISSYATVAAAEVDDVSVSDSHASQPIDQRIPSLKLVKDNDALPNIDLPHARMPAATAAADSSTTAALKSPEDIVQQLQTLGTTMQSLAEARQELKANARPIPIAAPTAAVIAPAFGVTGMVNPNAIAPAAGVLGTGAINHAPVAGQVSVAIRHAAGDGVDQITVQLDPVELGRIEVKLHMTKDGHTQLSFMVDRPETFDALSRDARMLEHSLQEAGIKADTSGMQFNLRQQPQPQFSDMGNGSGGSNQGGSQPSNGSDTSAKTDTHAELSPAKTYRLDIRDGIDIQA